ncbi:uncharacterized protein LOC142317472 [Lycorma delicatula]|uniref:uncharacterized protein LOC142317472 n=1 Tax=Lycorma delicatula TaxID=130591 RepID=UPI003F513E13
MTFAGCSGSNRRGELIEELMESLGGRCLNDGTPTYEARGHYSVLDLVIADNRWSMDQLELTVMDNDISSDHLPLHLIIKEGNDFVVERPFVTRPTARQVDKILDKVAQRLRNMIELTPDTLTSVIQQEMDKELRAIGGRRQVYWWSNEIARLRDNLQQARRRKQRLRIRGGSEFDTAAKLYIEARRHLNRAIKRSKRDHWFKLCEELDNDPWGQAYKIVTNRFSRRLPVLSERQAMAQFDELFQCPADATDILPEYELRRFTPAELSNAIG